MTASSARRSPRLLVFGGLIVAVVVVILVATQLLGPSPSPAPSGGASFGPTSLPAAIPPPVAPIVIAVNRAGTGPGHVDYPMQITASALGKSGIAGIELWVGATYLGYQPNHRSGRPAETARWEWTPKVAGDGIIVARAWDAAGRTSTSAPIRVSVVAEPPRSIELADGTALAGETAEQAVARLGGDPAQAATWNAVAGPLAAGTAIVVPIWDEVVPPRDPVAFDPHLVADVGPVLAAGLATPDLKIAIDGCTISAQASGGTATTDGFAFSVLPPSSETFLAMPPLATSSAGTSTTTFGAVAGVNYVTVSAYSEEASAPSAIVPVAVPETCGGTWAGDARLEAGHLKVSSSADRTYIYLRTGTDEWQRVPPQAGVFVEPTADGFDFGQYLPILGDRDMQLEAWGWRAGALVQLGTGSYTAPTGQSLYSGAWNSQTNLVGYGTRLDIVSVKGGGEIAEQLTEQSALERPPGTGANALPTKVSFKWQTTVPGVTHLQWQILPYPLLNSSSPTPPLLIDTGVISVQGLSQGYFSLDFKPYLLGGTGGVSSAFAWMQSQVIGQIDTTNPYIPGATVAPADYVVNPNGIWLPGVTPAPTAGPGGVTLSVDQLDDLSFLAPPPTAYFVRVLPYAGTTVLNQPSNPVGFDILEPGDPFYLSTPSVEPPPDYDGAWSRTVTFHPPTGTTFAYTKCVKVVKGGANLGLLGDWSNGTVHCRPKPDDGWSVFDAFESFVEWVGTAWDYVSQSYDWIQNAIVDTVLAIVPCEKLANQVADDGKEACRKLAKTALQAVAVAYGVPPSIPSWESTVSAYKGDLRNFILENAKTLPGVGETCAAADIAHAVDNSVPTCAEVIDKAVDESIKAIVGERSAAAASVAGVVVPLPTIIVEPDPRGMPQPPHFDVVVSPNAVALPAGTTCSMHGTMSSTVKGWTWNEYSWDGSTPKTVSKTGDVFGEPFLSDSQVMTPMMPAAGTPTSARYELWLTSRAVWFEPDGFSVYYAKQWAEWNGEHNHAYVLLQKGAVVTAKVVSNCFPDYTVTLTLTGQAWE